MTNLNSTAQVVQNGIQLEVNVSILIDLFAFVIRSLMQEHRGMSIISQTQSVCLFVFPSVYQSVCHLEDIDYRHIDTLYINFKTNSTCICFNSTTLLILYSDIKYIKKYIYGTSYRFIYDHNA